MEISIYTDGSCIGNPGPGGWAGILLMPEGEEVVKGGEPDTTNNRMEMTAIINSLKYIRKNINEKDLKKLKIKIYSDSNLIIQTLTQNWKRKKNQDLWAEMDAARAWLDIEWNWVKAHADNEYNNYADDLAQKEARKQT